MLKKILRDSFGPLTKYELLYLLLVFAITILGYLAEVGGIGLIFLLFSVLLDLENLGGYAQLKDVYDLLNFTDKQDFAFWLAVSVLIVFILRNIFQAWSVWITLSVRKMIQTRLTYNLFKQVIEAPYNRVSGLHSSRLVSDILTNTASAVAHCTLGIVEAVSAFVLLCVFWFTLFVAQPQETLIITPMVLVVCSIYWLTLRVRLKLWGERYIQAIQKSYRNVTEAITGLKSVKVYENEKWVEMRFNQDLKTQMEMTQVSGFMGQLPKMVIESVMVILIMSVILIFLTTMEKPEELVAALVLFGGVAIRMVPAISRIITVVQQFKISYPSLLSVMELQKKLQGPGNQIGVPEGKADVIDSSVIRLEDVYFQYTSEKDILRGLNLEIKQGSFVGFVGVSGSGKTTAADIILGLLEPYKGRIFKPKNSGLTKHIGHYSFVPQDAFVFDGSIKANIAFGVPDEEIDLNRVNKAIKQAALEPVIARFDKGIEAPLGENGINLSGGERQRLGIARALYFDSNVLVLDEPTSALDTQTENEITKVLLGLKGEKTIILIAHRLSTVAECDRLFYFSDGAIKAEGTMIELANRSADFADMLDKYKVKLPD